MDRYFNVRALTVVIYLHFVSSQGLVQVQTDLGLIEGVYRDIGKEKVNVFRKIPFAEPPVNNFRFRKPVSVRPWAGTLDATAFGPSCIQDIPSEILPLLENKEISEDCLHLNIFVPNEVSSSNNKSVMVWIHGGGFINGQASLYDGSYLALRGDVIVVTVNYRLGVFGFLSNGNVESPGNVGLWDQIEALKWVQKYIKSFGGNPDSVTIFGESAGGWSVAYLSTIPKTKGLFHRVIMQSGALPSHISLNKNPYRMGIELAILLKCPNFYLPGPIIDCIRKKDAQEIKSVQLQFLIKLILRYGIFSGGLEPVIDNDLISEDPMKALKNKDSEAFSYFSSLDVMAGCTSGEGSVATYTLISALSRMLGFDQSMGMPTSVLSVYFAPSIAKGLYKNDSRVTEKIIRKFSSNNRTIQARKIVDVFGDIMFYVPTVQTLNFHSDSDSDTNTFMYLFSEDPPVQFGSSLPPWFEGSPHTAELPFLFGLQKLDLIGVNVSASQKNLSEVMLEYWTNFAKYGDPNVGASNEKWPMYNPISRQYLNLGVPITVERNMYKDRMAFWMETLPQTFKGGTSKGVMALHDIILVGFSILLTLTVHT